MTKIRTLLLLAMAFACSCSLIQKKQELASEAADNSSFAGERIKVVSLNNEILSSGDLRPLGERLDEIKKARTLNGVFRSNSNEIEGEVILVFPPSLSVGAVSQLFSVVSTSGCTPIIRNASQKSTDEVKPNPLTLVAEINQKPDDEILPSLSGAQGSAYDVSFAKIEEIDDLRLQRLAYNSIELSADGRFFINEAYDLDSKLDLATAQVKQHEITKADIKQSVSRYVDAKLEPHTMHVIAHMNTPYESLLEVMNAANKDRARLQIAVRAISTKAGNRSKD